MFNEMEIARLLNVSVDTETGQVYIEMEVTDPTWKQKILRNWEDLNVRLVVEEKKEFIDEVADITEEDFAAVKEQIKKWR